MEKFNANDVVCKEGDPADRLYVIMEGSVEIVVQVSVGCWAGCILLVVDHTLRCILYCARLCIIDVLLCIITLLCNLQFTTVQFTTVHCSIVHVTVHVILCACFSH